MSKRMSREEFERGVDEFCNEVDAIVLSAIPGRVIAEAKAWHRSIEPTNELNAARRKYAKEVDAFIRRLPHHETVGHAHFDASLEPPVVIALTLERLLVMRQLMKARPPKGTGGGLAEHLQEWAIDGFYEWLETVEKKENRDRP